MSPLARNPRSLLLPLSPLYGAALSLERHLHSLMPPQKRTLPGVVLSVGSLSAGGAGKTPVVGALSALLADRGYPVRILSRGYGRTSNLTARVDPAGSARDFGDEPLLLARTTHLPVFVGADRHQAGLLAAQTDPAPDHTSPVFLLDDGFQHRRLDRDLDIVLLTGTDVEDHLLPGGSLREPLHALRRADVLVLREEEADTLTRFVEALLRPLGLDPLLWIIRRSLHLPAASAIPSRPLVFCGVARPTGFLHQLRAAGIQPAGHHFFRDHQHFGPAQIRLLLRAARQTNANGFLTTAKDAVKLTPPLLQQLTEAVGPVTTAHLHTEFVDTRRTLEQLVNAVTRLDRRRRRRSP